MKSTAGLLLLTVFATVLSDNPLRFKPNIDSGSKHMKVLSELSKYDLVNKNGNAEIFELLKTLLRQSGKSQTNLHNLKDFSFKDCGGKIARIQDFSISPDPMEFPGTIKLSAKIFLNSAIEDSPTLTAKLTMKKRIGSVYVKVPCVDGIGSCHYDDICSRLKAVTDCPEFLVDNNIPCQCPYKKGTYNLPQAQIDIGEAQFVSGDYIVTGEFMYSNQLAGCLNVTFSIAP